RTVTFRQCCCYVRLQRLRNEFDNRNDNSVSELAVGLCIGNLDPKLTPFPAKTQQARAFPRGQPPGTIAGLFNEDFRAILVIPGRQCASHVIRPEYAATESVSFCLVLCLVVLQILPQAGRKSVFRVHFISGLENTSE